MLATSRSDIFGKTADGKLWRIPITGHTAGPRQLAAGDWGDVVAITVHGNDLLAKKGNGELWHYPVDAAGNLGEPVQVNTPSGEVRL